MSRFIFAIKEGYAHRKELSRIKQKGLISVTASCLENLKAHGVRVLVWDFDGVLAAHGERVPQDSMREILQQSCDIFAGQVFILSNKPLAERKAYFKKNFADIRFIISPRKKPYPEGLYEIIRIAQCPSSAVCLIDDRLLTGALAGVLAGVRVLYFKRPLHNFKKRFFKECFFAVLRKVERFIF